MPEHLRIEALLVVVELEIIKVKKPGVKKLRAKVLKQINTEVSKQTKTKVSEQTKALTPIIVVKLRIIRPEVKKLEEMGPSKVKNAAFLLSFTLLLLVFSS